MNTLSTKTGKIYNVVYAGKSTLDGSLRIEIIASNEVLTEILKTFTDTAETEELTYQFDELRRTFSGYMTFKSLVIKGDNVEITMEQS